jgi:dihydrofolate reductase
MTKVFFSVTISLDGFIAPESRGDDKQWMAKWMELQQYVFQQQFFRDNLKLGPGGQTGDDNRVLEDTFKRTGVSIMGKRMFDGGEHRWPEEAPFHTPVFVLTHQVRSPWQRAGGTTFYFVNDGIETALRRAREVAGARDIRIAGGAETIREYLRAGLVDWFHIALAPLFMGRGIALFDRMDDANLALDIVRTIPSPHVTHMFFAVRKR